MGIEVVGLKQMQDGLAAASQAMARRDFMESVILPAVDDLDKKQNIQNWKKGSEGLASGEKWPALTEGVGNMKSYVKWKNRNWKGKGINVWRGDTRKSLTQRGPDRIARVASHSAGAGVIEVGTSAKLAHQMQVGQSDSAWQVKFLKEKTPRPQRRKHKRTGKPLKPKKWFVFFHKEIPARAIVRKSPRQFFGLRNAVLGVAFDLVGRRIGARTRFGQEWIKIGAELKRSSLASVRAA